MPTALTKDIKSGANFGAGENKSNFYCKKKLFESFKMRYHHTGRSNSDNTLCYPDNLQSVLSLDLDFMCYKQPILNRRTDL